MWEESKHPRDSDGKFRKVGLMEGMGENDRNDAGKDFTKKKSSKIKSKGLSKQELAIWYSKIGEIRRGYKFKRDKEGKYLIPIGDKIVVTKYDYVNPKIDKVIDKNKLYVNGFMKGLRQAPSSNIEDILELLILLR